MIDMEILTGLLWSAFGFASGYFAGRDVRRSAHPNATDPHHRRRHR